MLGITLVCKKLILSVLNISQIAAVCPESARIAEQGDARKQQNRQRDQKLFLHHFTMPIIAL